MSSNPKVPPVGFEVEELISEVHRPSYETSAERILNLLEEEASVPNGTNAYRMAALSVEPTRLTFEFAPDSQEAVTRSLRVHNMRGQKLKVYVTRPSTKHFSLQGGLVALIYPGCPLTLKVTFRPSDAREFCDELRLDSPGEAGLSVDLSAKPRCGNAHIPAHIDMGAVPLGSSAERSLTIPACADHDVRFSIIRNKWDCDLLVGPLWGVVSPGHEAQRVRIVFEPSAYVTALYELKVFLPTVSRTPFRVAIAASCVPAMARSRLLASLPAVPERRHKPTKFRRGGKAKKPQARVDSNLKPATPKGHDAHAEVHRQLGPFGRSPEAEREAYEQARQLFVQAVGRYRDDGWVVRTRDDVVRLGSNAATGGLKQGASSDQKRCPFQQSNEKASFGDEVTSLDTQATQQEPIKGHETALFLNQRTIRRSNQDEEKAMAGGFSRANAEWFVRYQVLCRFIAAARRAVTTNRLKARLQMLKDNAADTIRAEEELLAATYPPTNISLGVGETAAAST